MRPINSGRWGTVYKAYDHKEKQFRAVKLLPKQRHDVDPVDNIRMVNNEIINMSRMRGKPSIVELYEVMSDDENTYLVQELCGGNTLQEAIMLNKKSPRAIVKALRDITKAVVDCHEEGILFCDVKPSNMVYSMDTATYKLTDFGASIDMNAPIPQRIMMATPDYSSPELMQNKHASFPHDVWGIGIIAYQLVYGHFPSRDVVPLITNLDDPARNFISHALVFDPEERTTAQELLHHAFLKL